MAVSTLGHLAAGVLLGGATITVHLWLLRRSIAQAADRLFASRPGPGTPGKAPATVGNGLAVVSGMPLRTLLWVPPLLLAARLGLAACIGVILGLLVCRGIAMARAAR